MTMEGEKAGFSADLRQVGRVVATEAKPNTAYEFHFWTGEGSPVGIGTLVVVDAGATQVYGVVIEAWSFTDVSSAMHDYIGMEERPDNEPMTRRPEVRCYTAAVLRRDPEEPVQPVPVGPVYLSDDFCVKRSLRMDTYAGKTGVPIGVYQNGEMLSPVLLDAEFLLGPEAAHATLTGVSGLATKTSAIEFLLQSIFATQDNVACVCFNVKGHDMLFLDYPDQSPEDPDLAERYEKLGVGQLTPDDFAMYDALGVPCEAFRDVHYYAPYKEDQFNLSTLRSNPDVTHNVSALAWGLTDILEFAEVVLNRDDIDAKADAFIQYINQTVIRDENGIELSNGKRLPRVRTFQDLERWFRQLLKHLEDEKGGRGEEQFRTHNVMTIRKVYNRLSNLVTRYRGLLVERDERCADLPWGEFKPGSIYVIDIAKMDAQGQDLVVTRVVSKLREYLEKKKLGVEKCVVVVDELNKYAPSDGPETYLKKTLLDISERGRYIGLVLFSAQQFRSQVHKRVVGNCGTSMYGRMDMDELSTPGYQVLSRAEREKLATLSKGQLMVRHPHFSQAIFVKFPRPNILRGSDGIKLFPEAGELSLEDVAVRVCREYDRTVTTDAVRAVVEESDRESVINALNRIRLECPPDPLAVLKKLAKSQPQVAPAGPGGFGAPRVASAGGDDYDPFEKG